MPRHVGFMCQAICYAPLRAQPRSRQLYPLAINEIHMADIQQTRPFNDLIASHLFRSRTVLVTGEVNATMAQRVIARLFALADASEDPIRVVISPPGGHVESGI